MYNYKLKFNKINILTFIGINLILLNNSNYVESINYCTLHHFNNVKDTESMQLTKEIINHEYALLDNIKGLHCCAKGYRSIEWFKDGLPYPWPSEVSSLILYPDAKNQTIYSRHIQTTDSGVYKCVLKNDTHVTEHSIQLEVARNNPNLPLQSYKPSDQNVDLNQPARFYCEAFVGNIDLPDARNEIKWYKVLADGSEEEVAEQQSIVRSTGQIIGSYLNIPSVQTFNYGRYVCRIQISDDSHRIEMHANLYPKSLSSIEDFTLLLALIAAFIACTATLSIWYCITIFLSKKSRAQCGQSLISAESGLTNDFRKI